jgi:HTH-type transcriptional regulator/antitoxin HigA
MKWKEIKTKSQYRIVVKRTMEIFHAPAGSSGEGDLEILLGLIKDYEDKQIVLPKVEPIMPKNEYRKRVIKGH